jgi:hypothetical protein
MFGREAAISLKREVARESHVDIAVLQASLMRAFGTHIRTPYNAHNARFSGITVLPPEYFDHTRNLANSSVLHKRKHLEAIIKDTAEPTNFGTSNSTESKKIAPRPPKNISVRRFRSSKMNPYCI